MKEIQVHYTPSTPRMAWKRQFSEAGYQLSGTDQNPDIILFKNDTLKSTCRNLIFARRRFGCKPLLCLRRSEPHRIDGVHKYFDYILPYYLDREKKLLEENLDHRFDVFPKTKFCNFVYSNSYMRTTKVRMVFCKKLMEYRQVDCPGKSLNNMPRLLPLPYGTGAAGEEGHRAKRDFLAHYKFTIAFENGSVPHYISEKIFHPLRVVSIPIYWGCPEIAQYINPDCFINCHDFSSFDDVIQEVLKIDSDQQLYESYLRAPPILPGTRFGIVKKETDSILRDMAEAALWRRSHYKENKLLSFCRLHKTVTELRLQGGLDRLRRAAARIAPPPPPPSRNISETGPMEESIQKKNPDAKKLITHIFIVNPPGLGKKRRRIFDAQFNDWQRPVPACTYIGVNKNYLDIREWRYEHVIEDDRRLWVRFKLVVGMQSRAEKFVEKYGHGIFGALSAKPVGRGDEYNNQKDGSTLEIGRFANWLSQIKIWQKISEFPEDELCMVVEDRAIINPAIEFDGIEWPEEADFMHLWPGGIKRYEKYSDEHVRILPKWSPERCNHTSVGYILSPVGARRFLSDLKPLLGKRTVDLYLLYCSSPNLFATRRPWVIPGYGPSIAKTQSFAWLFSRWLAYRLKFLLPPSFRKRHPYLLNCPAKSQFDWPRLDSPELG